MKKIVLTLVALMALTVAQAQNENGERRGPRRMDPQQMMQNMEKELNLTAEQKTKFADVMKEQQAEMQRHQEEMKEGADGRAVSEVAADEWSSLRYGRHAWWKSRSASWRSSPRWTTSSAAIII